MPAADSCGCAGYLELTAAQLHTATGRPVVLHNDATDGWTTADVRNDLEDGRSGADLAAGADLVVIEVGANDLALDQLGSPACPPANAERCFGATLSAVRSALTAIVGTVRRRDPTPDPRIVLLGYWNVTVDGAVGRDRGPAFVASSDHLTRSFNTIVRQVTAATDTTYVDAYAVLKADGSRDPSADLLSDGDHPNAQGHRRLAAALLAGLRSAGAVGSWSRR